MRLDSLKERIQIGQASIADKRKFLHAQLERVHLDALNGIQSSVSAVSASLEDQASKSAIYLGLNTEVSRIATKASVLSARVCQLDTTLRNLKHAKLFIEGLEQMRDVHLRLASALERSAFAQAVEICESVHKYEAAGFAVTADQVVLQRFKEKEKLLVSDLREKLNEAVVNKSREDVELYCKMMFPLNVKEEALSTYFDFVRSEFGEHCLAHIVKVTMTAASDDHPLHVEAVTNIFLEVADLLQRNQRFVETQFGEVHFGRFLCDIEYEVNAHVVRVIRALMKKTTTAQQQVAYSDVSSEYSVRTLDFCIEELVTVIMRCNRFGAYLRELMGRSLDIQHSENASPGSMTQVVEELGGLYVSSEHALMSALFARAVRDDFVDTNDASLRYSSVTDDAFYIFKKAYDRCLLTSDANCICAVINNITAILQGQFKEFLEDSFATSKRLFSYIAGKVADNLEQPLETLFKLKASEGSSVPLSMRSSDSLPHVIGNVSLACIYVPRFKTECMNAYNQSGAYKQADKRAMFHQCVLAFETIGSELSELHVSCTKYFLQQLRGSYISPFIGSLDSVNFDIGEQGFTDMQVNDPFMRAFVASLDKLVHWVREVTITETYRLFSTLLCDYVALRLERSLLQTKSTFSLLGATQIYQDVSRLVAFFAQNTEVAVKSKFGRLQELCSILCIESLTEFGHIYPEGCSSHTLLTLKITQKDVRTVLALRKEFCQEAIVTKII